MIFHSHILIFPTITSIFKWIERPYKKQEYDREHQLDIDE
jgi:hypothetical protein